MKKIIIPIICLCLLLTGCEETVHWDYADTIKAIDNEYFKTKVVHEDSECIIIENEITGEYFLAVTGPYGISITPIEMSEMIVDPDGNVIEYEYETLYNPSMNDGAEGN